MSIINPRDWLGRACPRWPLLCRVESETLTQSINQSMSEVTGEWTLYESWHEDDVDDEELNAVLATHLIDHRHERTQPRRTSVYESQTAKITIPVSWSALTSCSSPLLRTWARTWMNHLSQWRTASAMPDLRIPSQLQDIAALQLEVQNDTAWWQRYVCVKDLPKVAT